MVKDMDSLLKKAIETKFNCITCPPSEEVWNEVLSKVRKERKKEKTRRLKPVFAACSVIAVILVLTLNFGLPVGAIANKLIKTIESFTVNTLNVNMTSDTTNTSIYSDPRISDAQQKVHFKLSTPQYIPKGYILKNVNIQGINKNRESVVLYYEYMEDNSKNFIQIIQQSFSNQTDVNMHVYKEEDTEIKHLNVNGADSTLIIYGKTLVKLLWDNANIGFKIDGTLSEKEAVKIAESIK